MMFERSLEVKLPTVWTDGKKGGGVTRQRKKKKDQRRERVKSKKMQVDEKVEKSQFTVFFNDWWVQRVEK